MSNDFAGRQVIVTGGIGALGAAVVERLLAAGAFCTIPCTDSGKLSGLAFSNHERVRMIAVVDLADERQAECFFAEAVREKPLWASIHVAGGFAMSPLHEASLDHFRAQLDMNATTCFLCCREAVKRMREAKEGRIVNVAARVALEPRTGAGMVAYTAAKAAVAAITQAAAQEAVRSGILVNAVVPSIMDTPANRKAMPDADHSAWARVADVAATVAFLASGANTCTRGALVPVYGRS